MLFFVYAYFLLWVCAYLFLCFYVCLYVCISIGVVAYFWEFFSIQNNHYLSFICVKFIGFCCLITYHSFFDFAVMEMKPNMIFEAITMSKEIREFEIMIIIFLCWVYADINLNLECPSTTIYMIYVWKLTCRDYA